MGEEQRLFLWAIPALPLLGALFNLAFGAWLQRRNQTRIIATVAVASVSFAFGLALLHTLRLPGLPENERVLHQILWPLIRVGGITADVAFAFDPLTAVLCLVITGIGALIHIYSTAYMQGDRGYWRFFFALNLFVFSMLVLVLADNLVLLFVGWEGVGVCSYLLIGHYYDEREKAAAALKAFIVNRVGDGAFIVGLLLLFWSLGGSWIVGPTNKLANEARWAAADSDYRPNHATGSLYLPNVDVDERRRPTFRFELLKAQIAELDIGAQENLLSRSWHGIPLLAVIGVLLFLGCTAKSAQIPLYVWLPDAMAGPTPVSALIHAATMVTAGVYLVTRLSFLFALSPLVMTIIAVTGGATALIAAAMAMVQHDLKRVLAYSTVSQLGLMFMGAGSGAFGASIFHLVTHAFFKACLFLAAGSVILAMHHEQDLRKIAGRARGMRTTRLTYLYACLAISGIPVASGFFSKDELLFGAFTAGANVLPGVGPWLWAGGVLAALGTSLYIWRSYFLAFGGPADENLHESPRRMTWVLVVLAVGSGAAIVLGFWPPLGQVLNSEALRHPWLERWLEPALTPVTRWTETRLRHVSTSAEWGTIFASLAASLAGWAAAWTFYRPGSRVRVPNLGLAHRSAARLFYLDELYGYLIVTPTKLLARSFYAFDRYVIDGAVTAIAATARVLSRAEDTFDRVLVDGLVNGLASTIGALGKGLRRTESGKLQNYVYAAVAGALLVIGLNLLLGR
ncbi:MAG: NADH-quinone oxidoreductase subunit L [Myxococcaceae bacterium]